jgi:oligosaccharide repeat unit polymerase
MSIGTLASWVLSRAVLSLPYGPDQRSWLVLIVIGAIGMWSLIATISQSVRFVEPAFFVSVLFLLVFFFRPLQLMQHPEQRSPFMPYDLGLIRQALELGALGFACFHLGYQSRLASHLGARLPVIAGRWRHKHVLRISLLYLCLGSAAYAYVFQRAGGLALLARTLQGRLMLARSSTWSIASVGTLTSVATVILGTYVLKTRRLVVLFLVSLSLSVSANLLLGSRSGVLVLLLTIFVVAHQLRIRRLLGASAAGLLVVAIFGMLLVLFTVVVGNLRYHAMGGGDALAIVFSSRGLVPRDLLGSFLGEFNQFDWLAIVLSITPDQIPLQWGRTFVHYFVMFVPAALWPTKPLPISFVVNKTMGGAGAGSPSTIVGELYQNFGVGGIAIGMVIFGMLVRSVYAYFRHSDSELSTVVLYAYTFASLHRFFTRSFAPKLFGFTLFVVPTILALRFVTRSRARSSDAELVLQQQ